MFKELTNVSFTAIKVDETLIGGPLKVTQFKSQVLNGFTFRFDHRESLTSVIKETIWKIRVDYLEKRVLPKWTTFTIWNAGKQGRKLYRSLQPANREKVKQFCDVDPKKTGRFYEPYEKSKARNRVRIPIIHFSEASPPFVTCVKLDLTDGYFEENLKSLNLTEGRDFVVFS